MKKSLFAILLTTLASVRANDICAGQPEGILLQNPDNCGTYWQCSNGVAYLQTCPNGLYFNPNKNECDYPINVDCPSAGGTTSTRAPTTTTSSTTTTTLSTTTEGEGEMKCPEGGGELIFFPSPTSCHEYFVCAGGELEQMTCDGELHWNQDKEMCDFPQNAGCKIQDSTTASITTRSTTESSPTSTIPTSTLDPEDEDFQCPNSEDLVFYPSKTNCQKYFMCARGQLIKMDCPLDLHWNHEILSCDLPENAGCSIWDGSTTSPIVTTESTTPVDEEDIQCPDEGDDLVFFPSMKSCEKYYLCMDGEKYEMECSLGSHWNQEKQRCDLPENAGCKIVSTTTPFTTTSSSSATSSTTTTTSSSTGESTESTTTTTTTASTDTTTREPVIDECPRTGTAIIPHPIKCDRFIFCQDGFESVQQCPHYYNFDSVDLVCLLKSVARCIGQQ